MYLGRRKDFHNFFFFLLLLKGGNEGSNGYIICGDWAVWRATFARCSRADSTHAIMLTWLSRSFFRKEWSYQITINNPSVFFNPTNGEKRNQNPPTIAYSSLSYPDPSSNINSPNLSLPHYTDLLAIPVDPHWRLPSTARTRLNMSRVGMGIDLFRFRSWKGRETRHRRRRCMCLGYFGIRL